MKKGNIHIGTSGWSYKHWKGIYYPEKMKPTDYLSFYAESYGVSEINTSFYHLPKIETVQGWVDKVPKDFRFCPKMSRYLTHMKKLHDPEEPLERFFEVFEPMRKHLGPVLIQLPPSLKFNEEVARHLFSVLKKTYHKFRFALEVRHATWLAEQPLALLREYNVTLVISQSGINLPYAEMITSTDIYVRFHGPAELYASSYSDEMLQDFASRFSAWAEKGHNIWAFFNNDIFGHAIKDAARIKSMIAE